MRTIRLALFLGLATAVGLAAQEPPPEKYIGFGDSITEGFGDTDPEETGYTTRLRTLLRQAGKEGAIVTNHGVGGETTAQGLSRINSVLATGGDFVLIMEGTNDIIKNISSGTTLFNLEEMVERAENAGIQPIWSSVVPLRPSALTTEDKELAIAMRQRSLTQGIPMVDNYAVFDYTPSAWPDLYNQNLKNDPVGHPNAAGYAVMAQAFADFILGTDTLPPVLGPVAPVHGQAGVRPMKAVEVVVYDLESGIDTATTGMVVDGVGVTADRTGTPSRSTYTYPPPEPWTNVVEVEMTLQDAAGNQTTTPATKFIVQGAQFFKGDINLDGRVDGQDLVLLAFSFGSGSGNARYRPEHDLDNDGFVGGADLAILANNFGKGA